jgi:plasmid stability protein
VTTFVVDASVAIKWVVREPETDEAISLLRTFKAGHGQLARQGRMAVKRNHIWWHNGTVNLTLKNIPDDIYQGLKSAASDRGRSLNAEAIRLLAEAVALASRRKRIANSMDELRRFKATLPKLSSSVPLIREDRRRR